MGLFTEARYARSRDEVAQLVSNLNESKFRRARRPVLRRSTSPIDSGGVVPKPDFELADIFRVARPRQRRSRKGSLRSLPGQVAFGDSSYSSGSSTSLERDPLASDGSVLVSCRRRGGRLCSVWDQRGWRRNAC
jgi:hypothetical protein